MDIFCQQDIGIQLPRLSGERQKANLPSLFLVGGPEKYRPTTGKSFPPTQVSFCHLPPNIRFNLIFGGICKK